MELWDILDGNGNKTGRTIERDKPMKQGDYHLVVFAWIKNSKDEFLISKRSPQKHSANKWETVGGSAIIGDDSLKAVLREVSEELGVALNPNNSIFLSRFKHESDCSWIEDIWLFNEDIDISKVVCQLEEVCEAKWATKEEIFSIMESGNFFNSSTHMQILTQI